MDNPDLEVQDLDMQRSMSILMSWGDRIQTNHFGPYMAYVITLPHLIDQELVRRYLIYFTPLCVEFVRNKAYVIP